MSSGDLNRPVVYFDPNETKSDTTSSKSSDDSLLNTKGLFSTKRNSSNEKQGSPDSTILADWYDPTQLLHSASRHGEREELDDYVEYMGTMKPPPSSQKSDGTPPLPRNIYMNQEASRRSSAREDDKNMPAAATAAAKNNEHSKRGKKWEKHFNAAYIMYTQPRGFKDLKSHGKDVSTYKWMVKTTEQLDDYHKHLMNNGTRESYDKKSTMAFNSARALRVHDIVKAFQSQRLSASGKKYGRHSASAKKKYATSMKKPPAIAGRRVSTSPQGSGAMHSERTIVLHDGVTREDSHLLICINPQNQKLHDGICALARFKCRVRGAQDDPTGSYAIKTGKSWYDAAKCILGITDPITSGKMAMEMLVGCGRVLADYIDGYFETGKFIDPQELK